MTILLALALVHAPIRGDLGTVKAGAPLTHAFTFKLSVDKPAAITGFTASCGCTSHAFDKTTLKPGETATLTVKINTLAHAAGPWNWKGAVRYKVGDTEASHEVTLSGTLVREITISPLALAISTEGPAASREIAISWPAERKLAVTDVLKSSKHVVTGLESRHRNEVVIDVKVLESLPFGDHNETLTIRTGDAEYPELVVPVTIRKRKPAAVTFTPEQVELGDDTPSVLVQVRATAGTPVKIAECKADSDGVTLTWSRESGPAATLRVKLASAAAKSGKATVIVTLAEPAGHTLTVPVTWRHD